MQKLAKGDSDFQKYSRVDVCTAKPWQVLLNKQFLTFLPQLQSHPQVSFSKEHSSKATLNWRTEEGSLCDAPEIHILPGWLQCVLHRQFAWSLKAPMTCLCWSSSNLLVHTRLRRRNTATSQGHFKKDNSPPQNMLDLDWECLTLRKQVSWQTSLPTIFHALSYRDWDVTAGGVSKLCTNKCSCLQALQSHCEGLGEPTSTAQL